MSGGGTVPIAPSGAVADIIEVLGTTPSFAGFKGIESEAGEKMEQLDEGNQTPFSDISNTSTVGGSDEDNEKDEASVFQLILGSSTCTSLKTPLRPSENNPCRKRGSDEASKKQSGKALNRKI